MPTSSLPRATVADTLRVVADVIAPTVAKGAILRRPKVVALAERLQLDRRAVWRLQRLRDRYGDGPVMLRIPGRSQAVVLAPEHVRRVLDQTPEPFAAASSEKRAALSHFQPQGVLASRGEARAVRRPYNDAVLQSDCPRHRFAARFESVVAEEAAGLLATVRRGAGTLDWDTFVVAWWRAVRRIMLGDGARDDHALTDMLQQLRADANWAFLKPRRRALRARFDARLAEQLARAEPGSLAGMMASTPAGPDTAPEQQMPQWLFASDATGIATFRALALLATHEEYAARARAEALGPERNAELPLLRAAVLESVRLWPTTPMILRQTTAETAWGAATMPAHTGLLVFVPFFHRDGARVPYADRFAPEVWLEDASAHGRPLGDRPAAGWQLLPFSGGPAICPGRQVALLLASTMLAALLRDGPVRLLPPARLDAGRPLPGTLNNFALRFAVAAEGRGSSTDG